VWVEERPAGLDINIAPGETPPWPDLGQLSDVVWEGEVGNAVRLRVHRDGMFVFELSKWAPLPSDDPSVTTFGELSAAVMRRVRLLNAHLGCLYTALLQRHNTALQPTELTPALILPMSSYDEPSAGMGLPDSRVAHLYMARYPGSYSALHPPHFDSRLGRVVVIDNATVHESCRLLCAILAHDRSDSLLTFAELLLRSAAAYADHDFSISLIFSWAVTEALLNELWDRYLDEVADQPGDGDAIFMSSDRRKKLRGAEMTASMMSEMLSVQGRLPFDLFRSVSLVRTARNKWMHEIRPVPREHADTGLAVAERLLQLVEGVQLQMPRHLSLQT
jgi:hypothetical protein